MPYCTSEWTCVTPGVTELDETPLAPKNNCFLLKKIWTVLETRKKVSHCTVCTMRNVEFEMGRDEDIMQRGC